MTNIQALHIQRRLADDFRPSSVKECNVVRLPLCLTAACLPNRVSKEALGNFPLSKAARYCCYHSTRLHACVLDLCCIVSAVIILQAVRDCPWLSECQHEDPHTGSADRGTTVLNGPRLPEHLLHNTRMQRGPRSMLRRSVCLYQQVKSERWRNASLRLGDVRLYCAN